MHTICTFQNIMMLCFETYVCNVCMLHTMGDIISGIGIGIAAADSIGYRGACMVSV